MSICSHALYLALTQDLQNYRTQVPLSKLRQNMSKPTFGPWIPRKTVAAEALVGSLFKKLKDDSTSSCDDRALDLFIRMNDKCKSFSFEMSALSDELQQVFTWAKTYVDRWCASGPSSHFAIENWIAGCDFGPGASVGASGTSFLNKVGCSKLTLTDDLMYSVYLEYLKGSPTWVKAEKLRRDLFGRPSVVRGSKLCYVPKTSEISRTICTEPSLNMFVQKGLASCLERCLRRSVHIDLADQQFRNKRLARIGSKTGTLSTIDLSSASDTISQTFVAYLFPDHVNVWLQFARSPCTTLPNGDVVDLHMVSSMGNAFTFPLQTMIFSAIVLGCYKVLGIIPRFPSDSDDGNFGVFGDDIVVRTEVFDLVCTSLDAAGFLVNQDKSFSQGLFRESCGGDYFDGHNVRGVYASTLKTTHAKYSLINRLNDWSANNAIPLCNTIGILLKEVRFLAVPPWESDIAGVKVPLSLFTPGRRVNGSFVYKRLEARTMQLDVSEVESGYKMKKFRFIANPNAILIAAIKGTLRNGQMGIRLDVVRPNYRFGVAPCWDYIDMEHSRLENVCYGTWKQAVELNVGSR